MSKQATIILDSGCFMPNEQGRGPYYSEIGYFESHKSVSDVRVHADGHEIEGSRPIKLGKKCVIEVRHKKADGSLKKDGVKASKTFHGHLLHLKDLYGEHIDVDRKKFDCLIHFDTGHFCSSLVKKRAFKEHKKQANGKYAHSPADKPKMLRKPIAHNVIVHFTLKDGEVLELVSGEDVLLSSKDHDVKERLDIEIVADNSTAEKFYRHAFKDKRDSYWLPNQGDPPPTCPHPPCQPLNP